MKFSQENSNWISPNIKLTQNVISPSSPSTTKFDLNTKISPNILLIIIILSFIFFISGLLHIFVRFLLTPSNQNNEEHLDNVNVLQGQLQELFHLHESGLDQSLIEKLPLFHYKSIIGLKNSPFDCSVCLSEFESEDQLRLLPKCSHAFHMECIDTWLLSHSTCPLCRSSLISGLSSHHNVSSSYLLVLESSSDLNSRDMVLDRDSARSNGVVGHCPQPISHMGFDGNIDLGSTRFGSDRIGSGRKDDITNDPWGGLDGLDEKIAPFEVQLGKFRNVDVGSPRIESGRIGLGRNDGITHDLEGGGNVLDEKVVPFEVKLGKFRNINVGSTRIGSGHKGPGRNDDITYDPEGGGGSLDENVVPFEVKLGKFLNIRSSWIGSGRIGSSRIGSGRIGSGRIGSGSRDVTHDLHDGLDSIDEKVVPFGVKLGKFRSIDIGEGSSDNNYKISDNNKVDERRCFSMGSYEYIMDQEATLKVHLSTKKISGKNRCLPGHTAVMFEHGLEPTNGKEIEKNVVEKESFSMSKIWLRGKRENYKGNDRNQDYVSSRRAVSFRFSNQHNHLDSKNEIESYEMNRKSENSESLETKTPSFARRAMFWLGGRPNQVVPPSSSSHV